MSRDLSAEDMGYAVRLANRGYDVEQIRRALAAKPKKGLERGSLKYLRLLDERGYEAAESYARRTAQKAVAFVRENPPIRTRPDAIARIAELRATADALPWFTYGGPAARRALEGALRVAERVGSLNIGLALREWSLLAGMELDRLRRERDRLLDLGWLRRNPGDRDGRTSRYGLRRPRHIQPRTAHSLTGRGECADPAGDAFRPQALGDEGWYVLHVLAGGPRSRALLAVATGLEAEAAAELLDRLATLGLITERAGALALAPDLAARLDAVAEVFGTAGASARDRDRYEAERAAFRARRDVNVRALEVVG